MSRARLLAMMALLAGSAVQAETIALPAIPLRAPQLARMCAASGDVELEESFRGYCQGYVDAVREIDPRFRRMARTCAPEMPEIQAEIVAQLRAGRVEDDSLFARDLVYRAARAICAGHAR